MSSSPSTIFPGHWAELKPEWVCIVYLSTIVRGTTGDTGPPVSHSAQFDAHRAVSAAIRVISRVRPLLSVTHRRGDLVHEPFAVFSACHVCPSALQLQSRLVDLLVSEEANGATDADYREGE